MALQPGTVRDWRFFLPRLPPSPQTDSLSGTGTIVGFSPNHFPKYQDLRGANRGSGRGPSCDLVRKLGPHLKHMHDGRGSTQLL
jgi:hypothetical protein